MSPLSFPLPLINPLVMQLSDFTGPIPRSSHSLLLGYRAFPQVDIEVLITIQADAVAGIGGHRGQCGDSQDRSWPRHRLAQKTQIRDTNSAAAPPKSRVASQDEQTEAPWVQGQADRGIASTRAFSPLVPSHFHLACDLTLYSSAGRAAWLDSHKALHLRSRAYWRSEHPCNQPLLLLVVATRPRRYSVSMPATSRSRSEGRRLDQIWTPSRAETGGRSAGKLESKEGRVRAGGGRGGGGSRSR